VGRSPPHKSAPSVSGGALSVSTAPCVGGVYPGANRTRLGRARSACLDHSHTADRGVSTHIGQQRLDHLPPQDGRGVAVAKVLHQETASYDDKRLHHDPATPKRRASYSQAERFLLPPAAFCAGDDFASSVAYQVGDAGDVPGVCSRPVTPARAPAGHPCPPQRPARPVDIVPFGMLARLRRQRSHMALDARGHG
jgi:hypothetical protein